VEYSVHGLYVAEESVAKPLASGGTLYKTSDIPDLEEGLDLAWWLVEIAQPIETFVWHRNTRFIRLNCAERVIFSRNVELRECIEKSGFANVWKTYYAHLERVGKAAK
jgi:hypothetical protein